MELRHLRYFVAVADSGSLTTAAERRLHTSQPSLSRQIRDLEREVGVQLLTRGANGVELTASGEAFLEHARQALTEAEAAKEAALRAARIAKSLFALGFVSGTEIGLLPVVDNVLRDRFPATQIRLSSDYSPALARALMRRKLDAAFMRPEENMEDLRYVHIRKDPLVFAMPSDHRLASLSSVDARDVAAETFCFPSRASPSVRRAVLEYFRQAGVDIKLEQEVHNVTHAISIIASRRAIMMLPAYTKSYLPETIITRSTFGPVPTIDLILAYHKSSKSTALAELLCNAGKFSSGAI